MNRKHWSVWGFLCIAAAVGFIAACGDIKPLRTARAGADQQPTRQTSTEGFSQAGDDDKKICREMKKALSQYEAKKKVSKKPAASPEGAPAPAATQDASKTSADAKAAIGRLLSNKEYKDNPHVLNLIAWTMVDPEVPFDKPNLDLALKVALRANELVKGQKSDILDTLARVYFVRGEVEKAIEIQAQSVAKAGPEMKQNAENTLAEYKAKKQGPK